MARSDHSPSSALGSVSGAANGSEANGTTGWGLLGACSGTTLGQANSLVAVAAEETPEVEVEVQNQGESTESGVSGVGPRLAVVRRSRKSINSISPQETQTVVIPLTPTPKGTVETGMEVASVPGEGITTNNEATYTVEFG